MKVGDLVTNIFPVHSNPAVHDKRYEKGYFGLVTGLRQTDLNKGLNANGKGDVYIDVTLSVEDGPISCGNYLAIAFEVVR